jgi:hypothetical protein
VTSLTSATSWGAARLDLGSDRKRSGSKSSFDTLHLPKKRPGKAEKVDKSVKNGANANFKA